jgi:hypothetical protein
MGDIKPKREQDLFTLGLESSVEGALCRRGEYCGIDDR